MNPESIRDLWQSQDAAAHPMPIEELHRRAQALESKVRHRNWREYGAAILVAAFSVFLLIARVPWHVRAGAGLTLAAIAIVCFHIYRYGSSAPRTDAATASREWYRHELERQRDLLSGVWKWYLGPMIPGLALWLTGGLWDHPERWGRVLIACTFAAALFIAIGRWNIQTARKLDKEISSL